MRKKMIFLALLIAVALVLVPSASATAVTFSESAIYVCEGGAFAGNPGCGTNAIVIGNLLFTVSGGSPQTVNTPMNTPFGDFLIRCADLTTTCGPTTFASDTLAMQLTINQTSPSAASGNFPDAQIAAIGGGDVTISPTSSNAQAQWTAGNSLTLGTIQYSITNDPADLNPPTVNGGDTTIEGRVIDTSQTPEPTSVLLFGTGLLGMAVLKFRRK